MNYIVAI